MRRQRVQHEGTLYLVDRDGCLRRAEHPGQRLGEPPHPPSKVKGQRGHLGSSRPRRTRMPLQRCLWYFYSTSTPALVTCEQGSHGLSVSHPSIHRQPEPACKDESEIALPLLKTSEWLAPALRVKALTFQHALRGLPAASLPRPLSPLHPSGPVCFASQIHQVPSTGELPMCCSPSQSLPSLPLTDGELSLENPPLTPSGIPVLLSHSPSCSHSQRFCDLFIPHLPHQAVAPRSGFTHC